MVRKPSTGARVRAKTTRSTRAKKATPKLTTAANIAGALSNEQIRAWVVSWLTRVTGRHVRDRDLLTTLPYESDADLEGLSKAFNAAFKGDVAAPALRSQWDLKDATVGELVAFLSQQFRAPPFAPSGGGLRLNETFASIAAIVASNRRVQNFVFKWFKKNRGQELNLTDKLSDLKFNTDGELNAFTDCFNKAFHAAVIPGHIGLEFQVQNANVRDLIAFLSGRVP
jgi:hypothetical protein